MRFTMVNLVYHFYTIVKGFNRSKLLSVTSTIVKHFYHEPVARGIKRPPPVYLTLNKLSYLILSYLILSYLILSYLILSFKSSICRNDLWGFSSRCLRSNRFYPLSVSTVYYVYCKQNRRLKLTSIAWFPWLLCMLNILCAFLYP